VLNTAARLLPAFGPCCSGDFHFCRVALSFIRRLGRRKHARKQTTGKIEKKQKKIK